jgi:hypothetical protein
LFRADYLESRQFWLISLEAMQMKIVECRKMVRVNLRWAVCITFGILAAFPSIGVFAQSSSSAVSGVIADSQGAVVAGARVTLKNADTNVERKTVSNSSGNYFFSNIPPARYTLVFSASTFKTQTISAFDVGVAQAATVNATLTVGSATESITVQATNIEVESSTSQLGAVIDEKAVNDLPLDGRNFTQLLDLTPGVTPISTGQNSSGTNTSMVGGSGSTNFSFPSINGAGNRATMYVVDGMNDNNAWYNTYAVPPIIDTIQEFKINSHNDSQYGGVTGGVVNIASKAGSNSYHGSAWEFVRANSFDANPFFASPPSYHLNTFGGQMGGAVRIPHLYNGKDKTFFEVGAEISHYSKASANYYLEPTAAQLGESTYGSTASTLPYLDFSSAQTGVKGSSPTNPCTVGATAPNTGACQLYDPTIANFASTPNRPAYLGNQIPTSEADPGALAFVRAVFTTAPIVIPGVLPTTYNGVVTDPQRQLTYNYTGRIDQHIGDKDFIFFRYAGFQYYNTAPGPIPHLSDLTELPSQQYGVSWLHVFNPRTSMQVQYSKAHVEDDVSNTFVGLPDPVWKTYGCSSDMCDSYVAKAAIMSTITNTGGFSGGENISPTTNLSSIHEWSGSVTRTIGNHQIQGGGGWDSVNYTAILQNGTITFSGASTGNFNGNPSSAPGVTSSSQPGFGLADFLLDYPNTVNKRNVNLTERPGGIGSAYLQDSWKMTRSLTVNYGLRYDRSVIPAYGTQGTVGKNGSIETGDFDFTNGTYIVQQLPQLCSVVGHSPCLPSATLPANVRVAVGGKILHGTKLNLGPHVGFAYRANNSLSLRGGYGISYDNWAAIIQATQNYQGSWPDTGTLQISNANNPVAGGVYVSGQNPFAANGGNLPTANPFGSSNAGNYYVSPYLKNPYSEQYNVGVEQQVGHGSVLAVNYVGSATHRMDVGGYYNTGTLCGTCTSFAARQVAGTTGQPFPNAYPVKSWDHNGASASYNALQAALRGNYKSGLNYMVSYTWSKALNEGSDGYFGAEGGVPEDPYNPKGSRGPAGYNIPQMLVFSSEYAIPFGKGKSYSTGNKAVDYVVGNWQLNGILTARSGQNFNVLAGGDIGETGNGGTYERADRVGNPYQSGTIAANPTCVPPAGATRTRNQWFNPCAYKTPLPGTLGNAPRNAMQAQNLWNLDASVFRYFPIWSSLQLKLQVEAYNALNHPVFAAPAATVTTPTTFGQVTAVQTGNANRILQFAAKIQF